MPFHFMIEAASPAHADENNTAAHTVCTLAGASFASLRPAPATRRKIRPSNRSFRIVILAIIALLILAPCQSSAETNNEKPSRAFKNAVVAADHPLASAAGVEMLKKGGNVVDAAVATAFALSVLRPESSGIGGGGFMVIWNAEKREAVAIDYRERAPKQATRNMYRDPANPKKAIPHLSRYGHRAVAVPGTVAGLCYAIKHHGALEMKTVLAPAIRLAREGFVVDDKGRRTQVSILERLRKNKSFTKRFATLKRQYLNGGELWSDGKRFRSPQLKVLERIARDGADGFYKGDVAKVLVAESKRGGGLITLEDLAGTKPAVRKALVGLFDGMQVVTMPPPSSGGTALLEMLNMLAAYEASHPRARLTRLGHNTPRYIHLLTEAMKHAFADRAEFLGDTDFAKVPIARLTDPKYAAQLAKRIDMRKTKPLKAYGRFLPVDDGGTSHFSIIDAKGNAVACTETINTVFGSLVVEPKYGIVLNNEMDDFAAAPGQPNAFGLIQSEANSVQPGKKPLSSMTPTILVKDGRAVFVAGASGGPRIISSTLQVLLNMTRFGMSPARAVSVPRFHHQWVPNELLVEDPLFGRLRKTMETFGHKVTRRNGLSATQAASRTLKGLSGGSDPRKSGRPAGY